MTMPPPDFYAPTDPVPPGTRVDRVLGGRPRPAGLPEPVVPVLLAALIAGLTADAVIHVGVSALAGTVWLASIAAAVALAARHRCEPHQRRMTIVLVGTSVMFATLLTVRASPWLAPLNLLASLGTLLLGASVPRWRSWQPRLAEVVGDVASLVRTSTWLPSDLARLMPAEASRRGVGLLGGAVSLLRGLVAAVPIVGVLALLLAAGDAVFASYFSVPIEQGQVPRHLVGFGGGLWFVGALLLHAQYPVRRRSGVERPAFQVGETLVVLVGVVMVYSLFACSQLLVTLNGAEYVREQTGMSYTEYAHRGFFPLLWAAGLTFLLLVTIRSSTDLKRGRRGALHRLMGVMVCGLTLVVVASAFRRLVQYESISGATMLRLYCMIFACWIGFVFVCTAAWFGSRTRRPWLLSAVIISALVTLFALNLANPEEVVVDRSIERYRSGGQLDVIYLSTLSADSFPALSSVASTLGVEEHRVLVDGLCGRSTRPRDGLAYNRSVWHGAAALDDLCASP